MSFFYCAFLFKLGYLATRCIGISKFMKSNKNQDTTKVVNSYIFELHLLRIVKFAHGVRQFIAAFNDGIYYVPSKCREINFTKQGGNELPHSKERCHARKSKIHFIICSGYLYFVIRPVLSLPKDIRLFVIRLFKSCGLFAPSDDWGGRLIYPRLL
jgi:hypothetical protein